MRVVWSGRRVAVVGLLAVALGALLAPVEGRAADRGVVHVVAAPERVLPAPGLPDLAPAGFSDEVWFRLDGRGWTVRRTSREGYVDQVASPRGIATFFSETGARDFTPASRLRKGHLRQP